MTFKHLFIATAIASSTISLVIWPTFAATPPLKTGMDVKQVTKVEVNGVKVENFAGQIIVRSVGTGNKVSVSLKGDDDLLKQVIVQDDHGDDKKNLYVAFEKDAPVIKDVTRLTLIIEMPAKMPLDLTLVGGKGDIGPRESDITKISLNGFGDIKLASTKNLESTIDGSGEITVLQANGDMAIAIRGDGTYLVEKGSIPNLKASIKGTGEVHVLADVTNADLKSDGAGTMNLATATGVLSQSISGAGTINIAKVSGSVKNKVSGSGQFEMKCGKTNQKNKV